MIDDRELRLECVKIAAHVSSPSMTDRAAGIVGMAEVLYSYVIGGDTLDKALDDTVKGPRKKRGTDMFS